MEVQAQVAAFVQAHALLEPREQVLLGLSGGADSVALLSLLLDMGMQVEALHVHHGIRGAEADRDVAFCLDLCKRLQVPCKVEYVDIPALAASRKCGIEETARAERYRLLHAHAGARKICVAHNATDNFETVLFHLVRGTGTTGLAGIAPRRGQIVRPCLCVTKEALRSYVRAKNLPFVEDSTNADLDGTRSFLRHRVLPLLRELRPDADQAVLQTCAHLREDVAYLAGLAEEIPADATPQVLHALPRPLLVRWLAARLGAVGAPLTEQSVEALSDLLSGTHGDARHVKGACLYHDGDHITVAPHAITQEAWTTEQVTLLPEAPFTHGEMGVLCTACEEKAKAFQNIYNYSTTVRVSSAKIGKTLFLRRRLAGDKMLCGGSHRTVKNLLQEAGVAARDRASLPFLCDDAGILWIPTCAVRQGADDQNGDLFLVFGSKKERKYKTEESV